MERERWRGSWFGQNGKQSSSLSLWAAQEMQWLPWLRALELGMRDKSFLLLLQVESQARTQALHHDRFSPGSQLVLPSCFLPAQWKPTSAVARKNTAKGHSQSPDRS